MANDPKAASKLSPADIARETIKQMALRRAEPNPDNYLQIYNEISGVKAPPTLVQVFGGGQIGRDSGAPIGTERLE